MKLRRVLKRVLKRVDYRIASPHRVSVARDGRVYVRRPAVYAAREVVNLLEALPREEGADLRAAYPVVAHEDRLALAVERRSPFVEEAQGEQSRALDARKLVLFGLAHVYDERRLFAPHALGELRRSDSLESHLPHSFRVRGKIYSGPAWKANGPRALPQNLFKYGDRCHLRLPTRRRRIHRPVSGGR